MFWLSGAEILLPPTRAFRSRENSIDGTAFSPAAFVIEI
jgi:hypothetical protein